MKFNDGLWEIKGGVKPSFALDVQSIKVKKEDAVVQLAVASKWVKHRGDTLAGPVLNVELSVPAEGVIGVKTEHRAVRTMTYPLFVHLFMLYGYLCRVHLKKAPVLFCSLTALRPNLT